MAYQFPKGFLWGAATSAHQMEGNNHNNWTEWEEKNAERLSQESGSKYPPENYISGRACDHYNRFREDFDIARSLGHNAHRFSIEWSRIEPEEGKFDEKEIAHYREVIRALRERGIEPFVTLWHWTLPIWFAEKGGFRKKENIKYFEEYIKVIVENFHKDVQFWITLNEPLVYAKISYLEGKWPPQEKSLLSFIRVARNLANAHKAVYQSIKHMQPNSRIGIAHNMSPFEVEKNHFLNRALRAIGEWRKNFAFLNTISNHQDFIGFNYYSSYRVNMKFYKIKTEQTSDMGWSIYPKGIYLVLQALKRYQKPIYITENGLADANDEKRAKFIEEHLQWIQKALQDGIDVRGYFHWSLLDNFEWDKGFWPRFGLVEVDYKTQARKIRQSAEEYKKIIMSSRA